MIFGFSSMGQPEADWPAIQSLAHRFDLDFIELRSLSGTIDLPNYFRKHDGVQLFVPVRLLGSSLRLLDATQEDIDNFLEYARLADRLHAPYVRIFGGGDWPEEISADDYKCAAEVVRKCRRRLEQFECHAKMLLETHSAFSSSERCLSLNRLLDEPLDILWDSHHTWRVAGETVGQTWQLLGPRIRHIHYKDSILKRGADASYEYVLPGKGDYPLSDLIALVQLEQFKGGISLEWEKLWHPELLPLETALLCFQAEVVKAAKMGAASI